MLEEKATQEKHMDLINSIETLEDVLSSMWDLVYRINPGERPPASPETVEKQTAFSLSEVLGHTPERIRAAAGSLRECLSSLNNLLF